MINITLPTKREKKSYGYNNYAPAPPPPVYYPPAVTPTGAPVSTMLAEAIRRDKLIQEQYKKCPVRPGDRAIPVARDNEELYGVCIVTHILDSYAKFGKNEQWPNDDLPLIVTFRSTKTEQSYWCSWNYLRAIS